MTRLAIDLIAVTPMALFSFSVANAGYAGRLWVQGLLSGNFPRVAHRCQPSRPERVLDARPSLTSRLLRAGAFQPRPDEAKGKTMPQRVTIIGDLFHPQVPDGTIDVTRQSRSPVGRRFANHGRPSKLTCAGHRQPRPQGPMSIHGHYGGHGRVDLASGCLCSFRGRPGIVVLLGSVV